MEEYCASKPSDEQTANETLNRPIKREKRFNSETENCGEKDEASLDANGMEEHRTEADDLFTPDVLLNYPHMNKLWNESSTRLFLDMYKELKEKYEKGKSNLKHRQRFSVIAENLRKCGFDYTAVQVENRFKSLKRSYQKKIMQEEALDKHGKIKPSHPSSQYHLYAEDMHEIFKDSINEMREAVPNPTFTEFHINDNEMPVKLRKRKTAEISTEDQMQSDGDNSESRSDGFHNGLPGLIQQLQNKIPETITCTTDDCRFTEIQESAQSFHFPDPDEPNSGNAADELRLFREDYNAWQKIREEGKNRRHEEKMRMYLQLIQAMTSRK